MGRIRDRRFKRALKKARGKGPIEVTSPMPNANPMRKPKKIQVSKGGSIRARLSSGGPVGKPN